MRRAEVSLSVTHMLSLDAIVARNVRAERARAGLRQDDIAEALGITRSTVSHMESERRRVTLSELPALCRLLDIPLSRLLMGADPGDVAALRLGEPPA
jgi:transcriptional regulator with XRE-family HTH domain